MSASDGHNDLRSSDKAGRINIGKQYAGKLFAIHLCPNGDILLSPQVTVHEREAWLLHNEPALESIRRGVEQSSKGETVELGSFADFADDAID